jgi:hypothetical protein
VKLAAHLHLMPRSRMVDLYNSTRPYIFTAWCLIKHGDNFTFTER